MSDDDLAKLDYATPRPNPRHFIARERLTLTDVLSGVCIVVWVLLLTGCIWLTWFLNDLDKYD
jgi:hypothetical protein